MYLPEPHHVPLRLLEPMYAKALSTGVGDLILIYTKELTARITKLLLFTGMDMLPNRVITSKR